MLTGTFQFIRENHSDFAVTEYNSSQASLLKGNYEPATKLLSRIHEKYRVTLGGESLDRAAAAVFLQGRIAESKTVYRDAYRYFRLAAKYDPENVTYLLAAGGLADKIALYRNAIIYYEAALYNLKQKSDSSPQQIRQLLHKLGKVWESRADLEKAQQYFQQAEKTESIVK